MKIICSFFFLIVLTSCKYSDKSPKEDHSPYCEVETVMIPYVYNPEDSIYVNLEEYKATSKLYLLLDSIIDIIELCPPPTELKVGFYFLYKQVESCSIVCLETVSHTFFNPAASNAIFFYKGHTFYYDGDFVSSLFDRTGKLIQYRGVNPDKYMTDIDDREYYWQYMLHNGKLQNIGYKNCNNWWHDDKYAGIH